jgi:hypothetical protein
MNAKGLHNGHFAADAMHENSPSADAGWRVENSGIAVTAAALHEFPGPTYTSILPDEVK